MARLDVYRSRDGSDVLLDCQADILSGLSTRFVVPLVAVANAPAVIERLNPVFRIGDEDYWMGTQYSASVPVNELGGIIASLADQDFVISNALDMLISGF